LVDNYIDLDELLFLRFLRNLDQLHASVLNLRKCSGNFFSDLFLIRASSLTFAAEIKWPVSIESTQFQDLR
jgi:hypothetical protein